jgi:uncharacterized lipoprotein YajG
MKPLALIALVSTFLALGGCATSRSVLDIPTPVTSVSPAAAATRTVVINSATDKRRFEVAPSEPNIPSLDPSEEQSDKIKARSVGRKRNTFGKALGDILLTDGKTVESLTRDSVQQAFAEKGYRLLASKDQATGETLVVDASIDKFWAWMNPGFASITLSTEISTDLRISAASGSETQTVSIKSSGNYQTGMEGNWVEVINKALRLYIDELKTKLK